MGILSRRLLYNFGANQEQLRKLVRSKYIQKPFNCYFYRAGCQKISMFLQTFIFIHQVRRRISDFKLSSLYVCMPTKYIIVLFVETPRKFITAKLSIRKPGSSSVLVINLRGVSTNKTII